MPESQSIIKKTESAVDDLLDLWNRRKIICIIVIIIVISPILFGLYQKYIVIPKLESKLESKEEKISQLKTDFGEIIKERDKAELKLAPFLAAANQNFPEASPDHRLALLVNKIEELATIVKQNKMLAMLERMQTLITTDYDVLSRKYPEGYFLFASKKYTVIPSTQKTKSKLTLNWADTKVGFIDEAFVHIILKEFFYHPKEIAVENLHVLLERKVGAVAEGIYFDKIGLYVELIDSKIDEIIYVIGFRKFVPLPIPRKPKPKKLKAITEDYKKVLGLPAIMAGIDTNIKKYITIKGFTITSGWE